METRQPDEILKALTQELSVLEQTDARDQLHTYINSLLLNDFNALVYLLYRADVDEEKLKNILAANKDSDASVVITDLLIQRMKEKAETRASCKTKDDIPEEEKW